MTDDEDNEKLRFQNQAILGLFVKPIETYLYETVPPSEYVAWLRTNAH